MDLTSGSCRKRCDKCWSEKINGKRRKPKVTFVAEKRAIYLPPECIVKILEFCDAKTVCCFSRCSRTAHNLVERCIKRLAIPEFIVGIFNHRGFCLRDGYIATRKIKNFELLNNEFTDISAIEECGPFEVECYKHKSSCDDQFCKHKILYRHISSGIFIFPDVDPLPTVLNCRHKKLRLEISLCGITSEELSVIHRLIINTEPCEVNLDLYPMKRYKAPAPQLHHFRRTYPFHYFMTDAEPQLCVRFWSVFRERVHAINLRNTSLGDWLTSFFLDFLVQGNIDHSWFAFPPLGTKEDEAIAFAIIRLIIEQWPISSNTPIRAMVTLPHYIGIDIKPQKYVPNVNWASSTNGGGPQCTIKHKNLPLVLRIRLFKDRLFLSIENSEREDFSE